MKYKFYLRDTKSPRNLEKIIFLCLDHEMETREPHLHNGLAADMDKAEACGAL